MKTLKELRFNNPYETRKLGCTLKYMCRLNNAGKVDFDVYLPTRQKNLQRPLVWTLEQKRELIWSVLLNRSIPDMSIINRYDNTIEIIDGKQRINALLGFVNNEFTIEIDNIEYFYQDFPKEYQLEFDTFSVRYTEVLEYEKPIPDDFKIAWFKQINFNGTPQDKEHVESLK